MMKFLKKFLKRRTLHAIDKLSQPARDQAMFRHRFPNYTMGQGSYGLPIVRDWNDGSTLKIGAYCSIADRVEIFLGGQHRVDWISTYPFPAMSPPPPPHTMAQPIPGYRTTRGDVVIGNDVWLCSQALILSGVTIGDGAVVAARSVVTRNVEPYSIVSGTPARHVRYRFPETICHALLAIQWWHWPEEEIHEISPLLCSDRIDDFLSYAEKRIPTTINKLDPSHY
jgi:acetyltransferase-like isoleucine patch superfamily enzyme